MDTEIKMGVGEILGILVMKFKNQLFVLFYRALGHKLSRCHKYLDAKAFVKEKAER